MPELIKLDEAIEGILDGVIDALEAARAEDGELEGMVNTVVRGDKSRPAPIPPTIWVRGMPMTCDHSQRSYAEKWTFDILILGIVKNNDPEQAYREANELTAKARSVVLKDRSLGKRKYVQDVRSLRFEPSGPETGNESLSAAAATIQVHFVILENNP